MARTKSYQFTGVNLKPEQKKALERMAELNATNVSFLIRKSVDALLFGLLKGTGMAQIDIKELYEIYPHSRLKNPTKQSAKSA